MLLAALDTAHSIGDIDVQGQAALAQRIKSRSLVRVDKCELALNV